MAHGPHCAAERVGLVEDIHDSGFSTAEEFRGLALFRHAGYFAVHSLLSLWTRDDSLFVSRVSSLSAASLGCSCPTTSDLSRRPEAGRVSPLVCPMVRAHALQMAAKFTVAV